VVCGANLARREHLRAKVAHLGTHLHLARCCEVEHVECSFESQFSVVVQLDEASITQWCLSLSHQNQRLNQRALPRPHLSETNYFEAAPASQPHTASASSTVTG
jgi:hypothetical protein